MEIFSPINTQSARYIDAKSKSRIPVQRGKLCGASVDQRTNGVQLHRRKSPFSGPEWAFFNAIMLGPWSFRYKSHFSTRDLEFPSLTFFVKQDKIHNKMADMDMFVVNNLRRLIPGLSLYTAGSAEFQDCLKVNNHALGEQPLVCVRPQTEQEISPVIHSAPPKLSRFAFAPVGMIYSVAQ